MTGLAGYPLRLAGLGPGQGIRFRPSGESDRFAIILTKGDDIWKITSDGINVAMARGNGF